MLQRTIAGHYFQIYQMKKYFYYWRWSRVAFDKYDGQPVIIWDDWRAKDLLSRVTVWKIFAINQKRFHFVVDGEAAIIR